ncbi:MAG TPA: hypothetical protein VF189_04305 [Patescibacteria group bacterium]
MAKKKKVYHHHPVVKSIAASNTWLIGLLLILVSIVFITMYNYESYKAVQGLTTQITPTVYPQK